MKLVNFFQVIRKRNLFKSTREILVLITYWNTICHYNPRSAYAISSFPPNGHLPAMMITGSHVF